MSEIEHPYPIVDMTKIGKVIKKLHDQVVGNGHRVHISRADCDDVCVMISKKELESLENAIAILGDTQAFQEMCENLKTLLKSAGVVHTPPSYDMPPA